MSDGVSEAATQPFHVERFGTVMEPSLGDPREAWGVLNPGGVRGPDGAYYLFPRAVAHGNYSRIGRARVIFDPEGKPTGAERQGYALEPEEPYETASNDGGVEDPRVVYLEPLRLYVMTYVAVTEAGPRVALAISRDLVAWERLGLVQYRAEEGVPDLNACPNKDAVLFPDVVHDPRGRVCLALLHRPSLRVAQTPAPRDGADASAPAMEWVEHMWISYVPLGEVQGDVRGLTRMRDHQEFLAPRADWERVKVGAGAPPVRLPYGWLLLYHGVMTWAHPIGKQLRYSAGALVLDLDTPSTILYRSPRPILAPALPHELRGIVPDVVFPTATDLRDGGLLDIYYGAADSVIAAARMTLPPQLPRAEED
jgi:predicted GH43/DUF377 family glycosyl hydrolase